MNVLAILQRVAEEESLFDDELDDESVNADGAMQPLQDEGERKGKYVRESSAMIHMICTTSSTNTNTY